MSTYGLIAAIARMLREKEILEKFEDTSEDNSKTLEEVGVDDEYAISELLRKGLLKQTEDGKFYKATPPT